MRLVHVPLAAPRLAAALALGAAVLGGATALPAAASTATSTATSTVAATNGYASTIALDNCSGALVRYPTSASTDRAMLLTNGHCYENGMPGAGEVLVDRASSRTGPLLNASGTSLGTVRADRLLYATMTGNDVALYRLTDTFATLSSRYGSTALTISASHPADGSSIVIPSSYWKRTWTCRVNGFVPTLREGSWTWHDSLRYDLGCTTIHGTSGSPVLDATSGQVVGINNTGNDDGAMCTVNNPCEVAADGTTTATKGQSYGQETYWFTTCLAADRSLDLSRSGCLLTKPAGTPTPTPTPTPTGTNLLQNAGFESGAVSWTGTSGPITNNTGRPARTGSWKLWLGGNGSAGTETVSQSVAVPSTGTPVLSFWMRSDTAESGSTAYDTMKVQVVSGTTTTTLATYSNVGTSTTYAQKTFDLSAYKGKTISVRFTDTEDSSAQTSWVVDDTALTTG